MCSHVCPTKTDENNPRPTFAFRSFTPGVTHYFNCTQSDHRLLRFFAKHTPYRLNCVTWAQLKTVNVYVYIYMYTHFLH